MMDNKDVSPLSKENLLWLRPENVNDFFIFKVIIIFVYWDGKIRRLHVASL
jgi:hypothetical protein